MNVSSEEKPLYIYISVSLISMPGHGASPISNKPQPPISPDFPDNGQLTK